MFRAIWAFLTDPETFGQAVVAVWGFLAARATMVRGVLMAFALGVASGEGPFAPITAWLGSYGTAGATILAVLSVMVRAGDLTPPAAQALAHANPDQLAELLRRVGVPDAVASAAAQGQNVPKPDK